MNIINEPDNPKASSDWQNGEGIQPTTSTPQKSRKRLLIIGIISTVVSCLCVGICAFSFGSGLYQAASEKEPVTNIIDNFMKAMVEKDVEEAYSFFSARVKRKLPISNVEEMMSGSNYALFDGYKKVEIRNLNFTNTFNTNPDVPQGKVANVKGSVTYESNYIGSFEATLEKETQGWRLHSIHVTVPPNKLEEYLERNLKQSIRFPNASKESKI